MSPKDIRICLVNGMEDARACLHSAEEYLYRRFAANAGEEAIQSVTRTFASTLPAAPSRSKTQAQKHKPLESLSQSSTAHRFHTSPPHLRNWPVPSSTDRQPTTHESTWHLKLATSAESSPTVATISVRVVDVNVSTVSAPTHQKNPRRRGRGPGVRIQTGW